MHLYSNIGAQKLTVVYTIQAHLHFQLILKTRFFDYRCMCQKTRLYDMILYNVLQCCTNGDHGITDFEHVLNRLDIEKHGLIAGPNKSKLLGATSSHPYIKTVYLTFKSIIIG